MFVNRSALYNPEFSGPFVYSSNVVERNPSLNPTKPSEIKLTPIGRSPENVMAHQVTSEQINNNLTERAH